jgi:hypothetical protein
MFSALSMQSGYEGEFNLVEFRDASLPGHKLRSRRIELRGSAVEGDLEEMESKKLGCKKKRLHV